MYIRWTLLKITINIIKEKIGITIQIKVMVFWINQNRTK